MTLKQFLYLAFGFAIGFIIYKLPISFFRFPLAGAAVFVGVAFAFIPIQERPLEEWLKNLIVSIYSPTQFIWQKQNISPLYLSDKPIGRHMEKRSELQTPESARQDARQKLDEYMRRSAAGKSSIDAQEEASLAKVSSLLKKQSVAPPQPKQTKGLFQKLTGREKQQAQQPVQTTTAKPSSIAPGIVAGMVRVGNTPLADIVIHIYDERGKAVRVLKTNAEGKFITNLALSAGSYKLEVEDPTKKYEFEPFHFTVSTKPLNPWLIVPITDKH